MKKIKISWQSRTFDLVKHKSTKFPKRSVSVRVLLYIYIYINRKIKGGIREVGERNEKCWEVASQHDVPVQLGSNSIPRMTLSWWVPFDMNLSCKGLEHNARALRTRTTLSPKRLAMSLGRLNLYTRTDS